MASDVITLPLDCPRPIKWTARAAARLGRLAEPPALRDLASKNPSRGFYALCAYVWAALAEREHPFAEPEDLAEHLATPAQQDAAWTMLMRALTEGGVLREKKNPPASPHVSDSASGPSTTSSSVVPFPAAKT